MAGDRIACPTVIAVILRVYPLRFEFQATDPLWFPPGKASNIFRGAFGEIFQRLACAPDCRSAKSCARAAECAYARMFEPRASGEHSGPSGFADRPRPFVLRAAALNGRRFEPEERFSLDVHVFDPEVPALEYFRLAFAQLCEEGLGPGRPRVQLVQANELPVVECDLAATQQPVDRIRVTFLTPTELKINGQTLREPRFDTLFKRARDRVTGLTSLYQNSVLPNHLDFRAMGERAAAIRMTAADFAATDFERRSARTGQHHGLGGFTGEAEYEGDLAEFLPYLEAAWWTGVGRLTVWGNGMVRTVALRPEERARGD
jgi:hypothetical protein